MTNITRETGQALQQGVLDAKRYGYGPFWIQVQKTPSCDVWSAGITAFNLVLSVLCACEHR